MNPLPPPPPSAGGAGNPAYRQSASGVGGDQRSQYDTQGAVEQGRNSPQPSTGGDRGEADPEKAFKDLRECFLSFLHPLLLPQRRTR